MAKRKQKPIPFPPRAEPEPAKEMILFVLGDDRYAIRYEVTKLPPVAPVVPIKK